MNNVQEENEKCSVEAKEMKKIRSTIKKKDKKRANKKFIGVNSVKRDVV